MKTDNLTFAGTILKAHGFEGAVVVKAEAWLQEIIKTDEPVFLNIDGKPVPFFPQWVDGAGATLIVKFDRYDSPDIMSEFVGCKIYATKTKEMKPEPSNSPSLLKGYTLRSNDNNLTGIVTGFIDTGSQYLLEVDVNGREVLVPLHEDLIVSLDEEKNEIVMDLPEGISTLND